MSATATRSMLVDVDGKTPLQNPMRARARQRRREALQAKYDAAVRSEDSRRHWANADYLSPAAAARAEVRRQLRSRARYEFHESNSFGKGLVLALAFDTVGVGPRLKISTPDREKNRQLETAFNTWARAIGLGRKLRTMRMSKAVDGEAFALSITNERLAHAVKLDLRLIEADQVTTPAPTLNPRHIDGIEFDADENATHYHVLNDHPGSDHATSTEFSADRVPADQVLHYFREDRPGQRRGIPEVTPALPLFAQLRRFTLATIAAAETAAEFAGVMYTDAAAAEEADDVDALGLIELEMRAMLTLPAGWKMGQVKAEHPSTTYVDFRDAILAEVARTVLMPLNKVSGSSAGYNFASGRLDHQTYFDAIEVERSELEILLERIFRWWLEEAMFSPGLLPEQLGPFAALPHGWTWPRHRHIDPQKQAAADHTYWEIGLLTDEEFLDRESIDPSQHYQQLEQQTERRTRLNLPQPGQADRQVVAAATKDEGDE